MSDVGSFIIGTIAVGAGILLSAASFGLASPLSGALISFGAGQMISGLFGGARPDHQEMQSNVGSPDATFPVIYGGPVKVGIKLNETWVDPDSDDRELMIRSGVISVASEDGTGIEDIRRVWLDEVLAVDPVTTTTGPGSGGIFSSSWFTSGITSFFSGELGYSAQPGTDDQTTPEAMSDHSTTRYPSTFRCRGLAWIAFVFAKNKEIFPRVPNCTVEVDGQHVYDPRDSTWKFSSNPALILLDYLTSKAYGAEYFYPERDGGDTSLSEIDEQSFIDAANYCDELISGPDPDTGTMQPRFRFNGWLDTGNNLDQNVDAILASMRGHLVTQNGKQRLFIRQVKSSTKTLGPDEIMGGWEIRRGGSQKVPNRVVVRYAGGESGDLTEDAQWPDVGDTTFKDQDAGHPQTMRLDLPGVDKRYRAIEIGQVQLKEAREDSAAQVECRPVVQDVEVGDVVTIDHEFPGWDGASAKDFWVLAMEFLASEQVRLTLKEYREGVYTYESFASPTDPPGSNLPDPTSTDPPVIDSLVSDATTQQVTPAGDKIPRIQANVTLPVDKGIDRVVFLERENGTSNWNTARAVDPDEAEGGVIFAPEGGEDGDTWEVGVYVLVGQRLLKSDVATDTVVLDTDFVASDIIGSIVDVDAQEDDFDSDGVVEGRLLAEVIASGTYDFQFLTRQGRGTAWTSHAKITGLTSGSGQQSQDVELLESENSFVALDVFEAGTSTKVGRRIIVTFDPDAVAHVTGIGVALEDDGTPVVDAGGDSDTAKIYVTVTTDGTEPADPTAANADATINARQGSVTLSSLTVPKPGVARAKARGENAAGQIAPASTVKADRQLRGGPGSSVLVRPICSVEHVRTSDPFRGNVKIDATAGAEGTTSLEVNYRVLDEQGEVVLDWQGWNPAPNTVTVLRHIWNDRTVVAKARDAGVTGNPESDHVTLALQGAQDPPSLPGLPRGTIEEDWARDGQGGEVPGDQKQKGRVYNRDGSQQMVDGRVGQERYRTGDLASGLTQSDGSANLALSKGRDPQEITDGQSVSFGPNYNNTPSIEFGDGGGVRRTDAGWSGDGVEPGSYGPAFRAKNADADGYTAELILKEVDASATTRTIASWTVVTSGEELHADKTQTAEADDDTYTLRYHAFVAGNSIGGECFGSTMTVGYYFDKGSGWVKSHENSHSSSCSDFDSDVQTDIVEDGIGDASGQGDSDNFRVLRESGGGQVSNPNFGNAVSWEEGANPKTTSATPSGSDAVPQVVENVSA